MMLSGGRAGMARQLAELLAGFEDFLDFDPRELHLIEALREQLALMDEGPLRP